jgi:hypothetical protein
MSRDSRIGRLATQRNDRGRLHAIARWSLRGNHQLFENTGAELQREWEWEWEWQNVRYFLQNESGHMNISDLHSMV